MDEAVAVMGAVQLGSELNEEEAAAIEAFLRTLTGRQPVVEYPVLPPGSGAVLPPDLSVGSER